MRRMFRAAGIAAAVAFYAVTSFAAPAMAQDTLALISGAHQATLNAGDAMAVNVPATRQATAPAPGFSQLFGHAVAAIATVEAQPLQPAPALGAPAGQRSLEELVATYVAPPVLDAADIGRVAAGFPKRTARWKPGTAPSPSPRSPASAAPPPCRPIRSGITLPMSRRSGASA